MGNKSYQRASQKTTPVGFEPTRGDPIGLAGRRLNRSAKVSLLLCEWHWPLLPAIAAGCVIQPQGLCYPPQRLCYPPPGGPRKLRGLCEAGRCREFQRPPEGSQAKMIRSNLQSEPPTRPEALSASGWIAQPGRRRKQRGAWHINKATRQWCGLRRSNGVGSS